MAERILRVYFKINYFFILYTKVKCLVPAQVYTEQLKNQHNVSYIFFQFVLSVKNADLNGKFLKA